MTVYADDMLLPAKVGRFTAHWSHLIADTEEELQEFATRLGLRRSWFQEPKTGTKTCLASQNWHYDATATKRKEAIKLGAMPVSTAELVGVIEARWKILYPQAN